MVFQVASHISLPSECVPTVGVTSKFIQLEFIRLFEFRFRSPVIGTVQSARKSQEPAQSVPLAALSVQYTHSDGVFPVVFCNAIQEEPK